MKETKTYYIDNNNNRWSKKRYTQEQAEKFSKTLIDCSDCSGCINCSNCSGCFHCSYCYDCYNCSYCSYCSDCSDCSYCYDCSDRNNLKKMIFI